jgi:hypothetical protein
MTLMNDLTIVVARVLIATVFLSAHRQRKQGATVAL